MGFVMLFNIAVILLFTRTRIPPRTTGPFFELVAFKELPYTLFLPGHFSCYGRYTSYTTMSVLLYSMSLSPIEVRKACFSLLPSKIFQINSYSTDIVHMSDSTSLELLFIINGRGVLGRVLPAILADRFLGPLNTYIPLAIMAGILLYCWIAVKSIGGIISFSVV